MKHAETYYEGYNLPIMRSIMYLVQISHITTI